MAKRKSKERKLNITIKDSSLSEEEKERRLFEAFDILLSNNPKEKKSDSDK